MLKKVTNTSVTWGPLENSRHGSVNAVRCWDEKQGLSSPTKEKDFGSDILKPSGELSKKKKSKAKTGNKNIDAKSDSSQVPSQSSVRVDNQVQKKKPPAKVVESSDDIDSPVQKKKPAAKVVESSGESDDNLDDFLAKIMSKKKSPEKKKEDLSNFIVADGEFDSDEFATPKLSLKDRIMKSRAAEEAKTSSYRTKTQIPDSDSDDELPELPPPSKKNPKSRGKKEKLRLPSSNETSQNEDDDSPIATRPLRKPGTSKKTYVIDSESDKPIELSDDDDNSPYYSDEPVNIYEPGNYHKIPPPSSPPKAAPAVPKSIYRPQSPLSKKDIAKRLPKTGVKSGKAAVAASKTDEFHTPTLTFLSSLTAETPIHRCHPEAKKYLTKFNNSKVELSKRLYQLYNTECFDSCLPNDFEISWNVRLTKTAGLCYSRRYRDRHGIEVRSSRIELSTKVIDSCDRLRDTLIHEMCHT